MSAHAAPGAPLAEYAGWLALYEVAHAAIDTPAWAAAVPVPSDALPLIDGAVITVDRGAARLVGTLLRRAGAPASRDDDAIALLEAAVADDDASVRAVAERAGIEAALAATAAALATMPLLQACRAAWAARIPETWRDAACPVCGTWAALVEARGLERRLRHRCGRCGADWAAEPVRCPFCGTTEHAQLTALVSERADERGRVEACTACRGYLKTVTTLTAAPPADVALLDLHTVHLDVAAIEHGFERPAPRARRVSLRAARPSRARRLTTLFGGHA
jgi:FdhE protein